MVEIDGKQVTNVYVGTAYKCYCGCSGIHYRDLPEFETKAKRVVNKIKKYATDLDLQLKEVDGGLNRIYVIVGNTSYIAYFD